MPPILGGHEHNVVADHLCEPQPSPFPNTVFPRISEEQLIKFSWW